MKNLQVSLLLFAVVISSNCYHVLSRTPEQDGSGRNARSTNAFKALGINKLRPVQYEEGQTNNIESIISSDSKDYKSLTNVEAELNPCNLYEDDECEVLDEYNKFRQSQFHAYAPQSHFNAINNKFRDFERLSNNTNTYARPTPRMGITIRSIYKTFHEIAKYYIPLPSFPVASQQFSHYEDIPDFEPEATASEVSRSTPNSDPTTQVRQEPVVAHKRRQTGIVLSRTDIKNKANAIIMGRGHSSESAPPENQNSENRFRPKLSEQCQNDVDAIWSAFKTPWTLQQGMNQMKKQDATTTAAVQFFWPLRMLDSWGKSGDGLMVWNLVYLGFMKECLAIRAQTFPGKDLKNTFSGQYCLVTMTTISTPAATDLMNILPTSYGTCVPSSCTADEIQRSLIANLLDVNGYPWNVYCQQDDEPLVFGTWEIIGSSVLGVLILIVIISTLADIFLASPPTAVKVFSAWENTSKILAVKTPASGEIGCLHGIRVLSICWIILGHQYAFVYTYGVNSFEMLDMVSTVIFEIVWSAYKAVDTFFVIGGFLLTKSLINADFCFDKPEKKATKKTEVVGKKEPESLERSTTISDKVGDPDSRRSNGAVMVENSVISVENDDDQTPLAPVYEESTIFNTALIRRLKAQGIAKTVRIFTIKYILFVIHRIFRLWPVLFIIVMFIAGPSAFFVNGPFKGWYLMSIEGCRKNWWWDLTLFNNVIFWISGVRAENDPGYAASGSCAGQSWYAAVDFQIYMLSPFLILPMKLFKRGWVYLCLVTLVMCLIPAIIIVAKGMVPALLLSAPVEDTTLYMREIYMMPYGRAAPYFVGGLCALLLHASKKKGTFSKLLSNKAARVVGWIVFAVVLNAVVFGLASVNKISFDPENQPRQLTVVEDFMYAAFAYAAWGACIGFIIVICATEFGGPVNLILSHPMWQPLSRITYPVYLISLTIQTMLFQSFYRGQYLSHTYIILSTCGSIWLSFMAGFLISVLAEAPFINLNRLLLKKT